MKKVLIALVIIIVAVAGYTFIQPQEYTISESRVIEKPIGVVFSYINDFKKWTEWSEWYKADTKVEMKYSEPSLGMGARQDWKSDVTGSGYQITREYEHNKKLAHQLVFTDPWQGQGRSYFVFESVDTDKTKVTWSFQSQNQNFMEKLFYWLLIKRDVSNKISGSLKNIDEL